MTLLGQQIARLLASERWEEWTHWHCGMHHFGRNLTLGIDPLMVLYIAGAGPSVNLTKRLDRKDRRQIRKLVIEMRRGLRLRAEERAIEELLTP